MGAGGLWRELGCLFFFPCPGKVNKGSLSLRTSSPGDSSLDSPMPLPSDRVFLPSLCFKPAIQSNYLLSILLAAVFYRLADCCCVSSKSLLSLSPETVFSRVKCFRADSSHLLCRIFLFGLQAVALFVHFGMICAFVLTAGSRPTEPRLFFLVFLFFFFFFFFSFNQLLPNCYPGWQQLNTET